MFVFSYFIVKLYVAVSYALQINISVFQLQNTKMLVTKYNFINGFFSISDW